MVHGLYVLSVQHTSLNVHEIPRIEDENLPQFDGRAGFDEVPIAQRVTHTDPHRVDPCRCSRHKFNQLRVLLRRSRVDGYWFEQWRIVDNVPAP